MAIQWNDDLLTGIDEVDNQHKEIFNRIIKLFDACSLGKGRDEVLNTFSFLEDYVVTHFKAEEATMLKYRYINYTAHLSEHNQFISTVKSLKQELEQKGATGNFVIQTNRKVVEWLVTHITKEDKLLAKYIREKS